jgi:small subunit ribosomal protein S8e
MGISRDKAHKRRATGGKHKRIRMKRKFEMGRQPANTKIGEKKITRIRVRGGNFKFRALRLDHGNYSWAGEAVTRKTRILKVVYNSTNNELVRTNTLVKGSIILIDSTPFKAWYLQYYNIDLSNKKEIQNAIDKRITKDTKDTKEEEKGGKEKGGKKEEKGGKKEEKGKETKKTAEKPKKEEKGQAKKQEPKAKAEEKAEKPKKEEKAPAKKPEEKTTKKETPGELKKSTKKEKGKPTSAKGKQKVQEDKSKKDLSKKAIEKFAKRNSQRLLEPNLGDQFKTGRLYAKISSRPGQSGRCDGYILEGEELAFYLKKINLKKKK